MADPTPKNCFRELSGAADRLLDAGRPRRALGLAFAAARKFPGSRQAAKVLEKTLSCAAPGEAAGIYAELFAAGGACPDHYYNLAMFKKRAGDYPGMRAAFRGLLKAPGVIPPVNRYIAFCSLDRYQEAFEAAEEILDAPPGEGPVLSRLWNPWGDRSTGAPPGFLAARYAALARTRGAAARAPYKRFLKGALLHYMGRHGDALAEFHRLPRLAAARYGWMRFVEGWSALLLERFALARGAFEAGAASPVSRIQSLGRLAEVHLCAGAGAAGFACLEKALREAHYSHLAGLRAWKGQLLLFTGRYAEAEKELTEGGRLGDDAAWCWRGAARALSGRPLEALSDLEKAVRLFPTDLEALVWRGEVLRTLGKHGPAREDFARVLAAAPRYPWALINRALSFYETGEYRAMREDFNKVEARIKGFLCTRFPALPAEKGPEHLRRLLTGACRLAKGNRRADKYFYRTWLPAAAQ